MIEIVNRKQLALSLYEKMEDNEMLFNYFGIMNFEISQYLLNNLKHSLLELNLEQKFERKLYSSMVEGMENIFKHTGSNNEVDQGIVMLTRHEGVFCLTLGNTVDALQERSLLENLGEIKDESIEQLKLLYKQKLRDADEETAESASLGLIQIALNCEKNYSFDFLPMNHRTKRLFILDIFI